MSVVGGKFGLGQVARSKLRPNPVAGQDRASTQIRAPRIDQHYAIRFRPRRTGLLRQPEGRKRAVAEDRGDRQFGPFLDRYFGAQPVK